MATGIGSPLALGGLYPSVDGRYVAANGKPFTSVSNAESALNGFPSKLSESCIGLTVLVKESGWTEAKEYWVQPKGTTPETYGLVEKGAGVTDYNDLDNKPTIGDGTNTNLPIVGNVKVSAVTASGSAAGVTVTPGQNAGEIEMKFTLPKGDKGEDGADGQDGANGAPGHNPCLGRFNVLPTLSPNPFADARNGDYIYFDTTDQQTSDPVTYIYYFDGTDWDTTGTLVDVSNLSFSSGQDVVGVAIKDLDDEDPTAEGVLSAAAGVELLRKIKEHHEIDGTAQSSSSTTVEIIPAAANNVECKAGDILFFDVDGIGTVYEQVRYFLNGDNNTPYYINEKYTFAPLTSDLAKIRVAAVAGKYIEDGTITCNIYKVGQETFVKLIEELLGRVSNVEDAATQIPALESAINSIQLEMNSTVLVNASGSVPSGTPATYNLFNGQTNKIPANSDVRFEVTGLGAVCSQINWYISGAREAVAHPLTEPVTIQHFNEETNIGRVAVTGSKIIGTSGGAVSFKATIVGLKEKVEELANNTVKSVLQLLQEAANVTDNFFTNSFNTTIHAPSYSGNLIFTCVSKYTIDANYVSGEPTIRIVGVGGSEGFNCPATYNMSNFNDFTFKQWRLPQLKEGVLDSIKIEITIPTGVELIISSFEVAVEPKASRGEILKIYSHGNMANSNFCTKGAWDRAAQCGAYGCIAVPKITSDGVLVSYHNDGNVNSDMMYVDRSTIADGVTIANSTFETTQTWRYKTAFLQRFGNYKEENTDIADTARIPKLEELFKLCVKTGIKPCLSVHPLPASDDEAGITAFTSMLTDIKTLTDKYNITNLVSFKIGSSGVHCLQYLFQVFGNSVDCVMISGAGNLSLANVISSLSNSGFDKTKITLGAEFNGVNDYPNYIDGLNTEGYIVGVFGESIQATVIMGLIDAGVQEITLNNFYSWGLNW